jgi:nucleoside-diphosphate-sugar epimerase
MKYMETVLVVGGGGFIGSHLVEKLARIGYKTIVYDSRRPPFTDDPLVHKLAQFRWSRVEEYADYWYVEDVRDGHRVFEAMKTYQPDVVVYLPSLLAKESDQQWQEALAIHAEGLCYFLEAASSNNRIRRFVYVSSSFVYGHFQHVPADEKHARMPLDTYGRSKLIGEEFVQAYASKAGFEFTIVRPAGVYGFGDTHIFVERTVTTMLYSAIMRKPFTVPWASNLIDFTYVKDLVQGLFLSMFTQGAQNQIFNITYGQGRSVKEFAHMVQLYVPDFSPTLLDPPRLSASHYPIRGALDISKARAVLGYQPQFSLEAGIKDCLDTYQTYLVDYEPC